MSGKKTKVEELPSLRETVMGMSGYGMLMHDGVSITGNLEKVKHAMNFDGYHTFDELYQYRMAYNALLFNEWYKQGKYNVHWSRKHSDGELCFGGGWFVVVAETPDGQITNHYELKDLQWFAAIEEREMAVEWDGHTPQQAFERMRTMAFRYSIPF